MDSSNNAHAPNLGDVISMRDYIDARFSSMDNTVMQLRNGELERALAFRTQSELVAAAIEQRFKTIDSNTALAAQAVEKRLEGMNEFRAQLSSQTATFVTRVEHENLSAAIAKMDTNRPTRIEMEKSFDDANKERVIMIDRIGTLEKAYANLQGRMWAIGVGFSVLTILIDIGLRYLR